MALERPLCTVDQVKSELKNTALDVAIYEGAINAASRWIEDVYLCRRFDYLDASATPWTIRPHQKFNAREFLYLPRPILTLTAVAVLGETWVDGTDFVADSDGTKIIAARGYWFGISPVASPFAWQREPNKVKDTIDLTGTFGYPAADAVTVPTGVPRNISRAAVLIAAALTSENKKDALGLDGSRVSLTDKNIPKTALQLLGGRPLLV